MLVKDWNPCIITEVNTDLDAIAKQLGAHVTEPRAAARLVPHQLECFSGWLRQAQDKLLAQCDIGAFFSNDGLDNNGRPLPLVYRATFNTASARSNSANTQHFGGVPDFSELFSWSTTDNHGEFLEATWPRCGYCNRPMRFVSQFVIPLQLTVLHYLVRDRHSHEETALQCSAAGNCRHLTNPIQTKRWSVFVCDDAGEHEENPCFDAHVLITAIRGTETKNDELAQSTERFMARHRVHPKETTGLAPTYTEISDIELGLDLDVYQDLPYSVQAAADAIIGQEYELFGARRRALLFGTPLGGASASRPLSQKRDSAGRPCAMTPLMQFASASGIPVQIYADTLSSTANSNGFYCKVDVRN